MKEFFVDLFRGKYQGNAFELAVFTGVSSCKIWQSCSCRDYRVGFFASAEWAGDDFHNHTTAM